jgi:hypothetical protein
LDGTHSSNTSLRFGFCPSLPNIHSYDGWSSTSTVTTGRHDRSGRIACRFRLLTTVQYESCGFVRVPIKLGWLGKSYL